MSYCDTTGKINHTGACLIAFSGVEAALPHPRFKSKPSQKPKGWKGLSETKDRLSDAGKRFIEYAQKENHGIRESNIARLLLPVGISSSQIDAVLVTELDDYGRIRGSFAHTSSLAHTKTAINPEDEFKKVRQILSLLEPIDQSF